MVRKYILWQKIKKIKIIIWLFLAGFIRKAFDTYFLCRSGSSCLPELNPYILIPFQLWGTMWASGCRNCNLTLAERTFFCCLFFDFFLCVFQFSCKSVHNFHHNEYDQSHDQEINDCRNEFAIIQCNFSQKIHFNWSKFIPPNNPRIGLMISSTRMIRYL